MIVSKSAAVEGSVSSTAAPAPAPLPKKKRNLPGMPDPKAEVIALSPKSLLATNRFVCEICSKGFQRDQNLQLHRRGHNLPWKLRQRNGKEEVRKKVYVCPEPGCVHHNPSRALGDLTGIKKHFSRKHGEKKWKCEKCSKSYAVLSDWKAHSKTCGTREYRCSCGTLFSRRDSFITHRAFCDALVEENARPETKTVVQGSAMPRVDEEVEPPEVAASPDQLMLPAPPEQLMLPAPPEQLMLPAPPEQQESKNATELLQYPPPQQPSPPASMSVNSRNSSGTAASGGSSNSSPTATTTSTSLFASLFASSGAVPVTAPECASYSDLMCGMSRPDRGAAAAIIEPLSLRLSTNSAAPLLPPEPPHLYFGPQTSPHMSATALLQKAAEMGASSSSSATALLQKAAQMGAASSSSFLRSLGLATPSGGGQLENFSAGQGNFQWQQPQKHLPPEQPEPLLSAGLGLGLAYDGGVTAVAASLPELMMGSSSLFGPKPATLDFLGRSWSSPPAKVWDDRKPSSSSAILELAAGENKNNSNDPFALFN